MKNLWRSMGLNVIWYVPIWTILLFVSLNDLVFGIGNYINIVKYLHWFSLDLLISPAAYLFLSVTVLSITIPVGIWSIIPIMFVKDKNQEKFYRNRYVFSLLALVAILAALLIISVIMWGSYPVDIGNSNSYIRFIPFLPWPTDQLVLF